MSSTNRRTGGHHHRRRRRRRRRQLNLLHPPLTSDHRLVTSARSPSGDFHVIESSRGLAIGNVRITKYLCARNGDFEDDDSGCQTLINKRILNYETASLKKTYPDSDTRYVGQ